MPSHQIESILESGDVLFTSIPNALYRRVAQATGSKTSHVGIAFHDPDAGWLIAESAVPTVRYSPIADFISRSDKGWRLWFFGRIPWTRRTVTPASQLASDRLETVWETSPPPSLASRQHA